MVSKETEKIIREIHEKFNDIDKLIEKYKKSKKEDKPQGEMAQLRRWLHEENKPKIGSECPEDFDLMEDEQ